uniref:RNA-polymerase II-associated protein 3-like C-terminal domain-containing protein n=1 Tax=Chromera velia CCMP2878 TaxID=1169474 RepID=A0A0G4I231_9ALVE|eukprot:Cvel_10290.t1-p1 / transcript=Cvel_10290.t1 / gene=Cvel_10290 / organism=Chromera_velia_CCMP2878 / gene_product=Sperm-associated antigen 1, putative / transcript_product=Sperm-associated antigen 1, putative / location=Cvel_scaffold618:4130-8003(+) / protein_length=357 / sequence_SO=supercontig / SO=protein_coding / is_pseudo=false
MSFDIQRQIRENSQSIQEYYGDLLSWQKEVKSKTKAAPKKTRQEKRALFLGQESVSSSSGKNSNKGTRGVQGKGAEGGAERSSEREKGQQSKESEGGPRGKKKYARDGNTVADYYKAWDAFDVDAELEKASGDEEETGEEGKGASTRVSDLPQMKGKAVSGAKPNMRVAVRGGGFRQSPLDRAKEKKEEGNKLFASGALKDALRAYSQAADSLSAAFGPYLRDILKVRGGQDTEALFGDSGAGGVSAQPLVPLTEDQETAVREAWAAVLSNRALVSLKLGRAKETVLDCDLSLRLKPANAKAYFRRGMALQKLKVMDQAENGGSENRCLDLRKALELDPQDIKTRTELQSVLSLPFR